MAGNIAGRNILANSKIFNTASQLLFFAILANGLNFKFGSGFFNLAVQFKKIIFGCKTRPLLLDFFRR